MTDVFVVLSNDGGEVEIAFVCATLKRAKEKIKKRISLGGGWTEDDFKVEQFTVED